MISGRETRVPGAKLPVRDRETDSEMQGAAPLPDDEELERGRKLFAGKCRFVMSAVALDSMPPGDRPEICMAGRSNVGKSTLINALAGQRQLARSSGTPGRTRELNVFEIGTSHRLIDLPGYGFARMPKKIARRSADLIDGYLAGRSPLRRAFLLVDGRRGPLPIDEAFMLRLDEAGVAFQIVLTKLDKVGKSALGELAAAARGVIDRHPAALPAFLAVSAQSGAGVGILRSQIAEIR